ncbi:MAG TPA: Rrf2 family transcriptional regulator [Myxococcota bacterium]|nr:Rrf2 family transcriptional regulator [Myxococcota bacterium]
MRLTAQDEYGLRCLLAVARCEPSACVTIAAIAERENLSRPYVGKLMRLLREAGLVSSTRGQKGGYTLVGMPGEIRLSDVLEALDERLNTPCEGKRSAEDGCVHDGDCSIRALWSGVDQMVHAFLAQCTLADLLQAEPQLQRRVGRYLQNLPELSR